VLYTCWAAKGGSGVTVVAALLALARARADGEVLLVDLAGDLPAVLALGPLVGPGLGEWVAAPTAPPDALGRLEVPVVDGVTLLPRGRGTLAVRERTDLLASLLVADGRTVVVDAGVLAPAAGEDDSPPAQPLVARADHSLLVIRPCYLAVQRAARLTLRPTAAIVVDEDGRALDAHDIANVLGVPVVATLPVEPAIARAVDAGLLVTRPPRRACRALRGVA
jgi:hypothetical protein